MKLKEYLDSNNIKIQDFASKIQYTRQYVGGYLNSRYNVSKKFAAATEEATDGAVTIADILSENKKSLLNKTILKRNIK